MKHPGLTLTRWGNMLTGTDPHPVLWKEHLQDLGFLPHLMGDCEAPGSQLFPIRAVLGLAHNSGSLPMLSAKEHLNPRQEGGCIFSSLVNLAWVVSS